MRVLLIALQSYMPEGYRAKLRWLATAGRVDLTLATMRSWSGPAYTETWQQADEPFPVRFIEPLALASHPALRCVTPHALRRLIDETQPDVVHVEAEPHALLTASLASMRRRAAWRLVGFSWENIQRRGKPPLGWLERSTLARVDHMIVGNSEGQAVIRWRGYEGPVSVVPQFGFAPEQFAEQLPAPDQAAADGATFRLGYAGRLAEEKGLDDLLSAQAQLPRTTHLYLLGSGPQEQALRQHIAALGLSDRVHLLGNLPHGEVVAWMQHLDALVLPSRTLPWWKEQFGRVLVEAMLSRTVVVGSDSGAIPEVIAEAGLVFPEGDVDALTTCLRRLHEDPALGAELARAGHSRAMTRYTGQAVGQATLEVYRSVLGEV